MTSSMNLELGATRYFAYEHNTENGVLRSQYDCSLEQKSMLAAINPLGMSQRYEK